MLGARIDADTVAVHPSERGNLKQALLKLGWPAEDFAGYVDGEAHAIALDESDWTLRAVPAGGGRVVLARRLRGRRTPLRRGQDPGRRRRDGAGAGDHADPGHQHRQRPPVEARAGRGAPALTEDEIGEYSRRQARRSGRSPSRRTRC